MYVKYFFPLFLIIALFSCDTPTNQVFVSNETELSEAIENSLPGDELVMANGIWKDVAINFVANGTSEKPIVLRAENPGQVFIEGQSYLKFGGEYLVVKNLHFRNGATPEKNVVEFKRDKIIANHCKFTHCVIENFNQPQRDRADHWVEFWGRNNELSYCNIIGKSNSGPTVRVQLKGNEHVYNYHKIINNHFGPRPRKGGPHGETIQIGDSYTSMTPCHTLVANNLFDRCNGEVEVISSKANFNEFRGNVFYHCEGSLVTRHGNYALIDGNYFIGDGKSENIGGIRIVNSGHWVTNNYFYNILGNNFRSALAVMNGIPKSPLNRYNQVTDVVVAYNTWVNCKSPWQFGVGTNIDQKDVLPPSEIRSARPIRTTVANNIIYNEKGDNNPVVCYDKIDEISFKKNVIDNQEIAFNKIKGLKTMSLELQKLANDIFNPVGQDALNEMYDGFGFGSIKNDLLGNPRSEKNTIGAISADDFGKVAILDSDKYGACWFEMGGKKMEIANRDVADVAELIDAVEKANEGDVINLTGEEYQLSAPIQIKKGITIQTKNKDAMSTLKLSQNNGTMFKLFPFANLIIKGVDLEGESSQIAFAPLQEGMSSLYNLTIENCFIHGFDYAIKGYKETFADEITVIGTQFSNCKNGIELSQETNDKGDYNVEFLTIDNCTFENIDKNVIDYYRGGYDESTIGGNLKVSGCTFTGCGSREKNGILINHRGIINVELSENIFKNNKVKLVAMLWGAKNNTEANNTLSNSGKIMVQQNLKQTMMY